MTNFCKLDNELNKVSIAVEFEKKTGIPKVFVAAGLGIVLSVLIFMNIWGDLLTNLLGFIYPAYASFKALESDNKDDDVQWLTYWVVFGFLNIVEFFSDILLFWLPFYYVFKAAGILWLAMPQTKGAVFVYQRILRPFLVSEEKEIDRLAARAAKAASDALKQQ